MPIRILLADKDQKFLEDFGRKLKYEGFEVVTASTSEEAEGILWMERRRGFSSY